MAGRSSDSDQRSPTSAALGPSATRGRLALLTALRTAVPVLVFLALAASPSPAEVERVAALLTAQVAFGFASIAFATRQQPALTPIAVWASIAVDLVVASALVQETGGPAGPLTFLFGIEALTVGIAFSAASGVRVLGIALAAVAALYAAEPPGPARYAGGIVGTFAVAGIGIAIAAVVEREARRRTAELATTRQIALDVQDSLTMEEILSDLCRGVVNGLGFSSSTVLLPAADGATLSPAGGCGLRGATRQPVERRGGIARALDEGRMVVVSADHARQENVLTDLIGARGYVAMPIGDAGVLVVTRAPKHRGLWRGRFGKVRAHELEPLMALAQQAAVGVANARLHSHVAAMAVTDPLTELANHRELQRVLAQECERQRRYGASHPGHHVSLVLIDIDRFKGINDRFGHPAGDEVLRTVSHAIRGAVRSFDLVARYGGEEFAVVLPETDEDGAMRVAERARKAVRDLHLEIEGRRVPVTISIGVATAPEDGLTPAQLIAAADAALYRSKDTGRNRSTHAGAVGKRLPTIAGRRLTANTRAAARRRSA